MDKQEFSLGVKHQLFNNEVRKRRLQMGYTQRQLGKLCGIGEAMFSQIETFRQYPNFEKAKKIAEVLNTPLQVLFPKWIEILKTKETSVTTEHLVTERILEHPELKSLPAEVGNVEDLESEIDIDLLKDKLKNALDTLSDREQKVLEFRYGFEEMPDKKDPTFANIGRVFGVTNNRIKQIHDKALRKMRHPSRKSNLQKFI